MFWGVKITKCVVFKSKTKAETKDKACNVAGGRLGETQGC